jgi:DNA-directed RNA polymerase specialized sigma24 family protein
MILEELSKKDKLWRSIAFNICKDKSLSDELTQQMYVKVYEISLKRNIDTNDYYIAKILLNLFIDYIKENKKFVTNTEVISLISNDESFTMDDEQLNIINDLSFIEKELILLNENLSYHEIQRKYNINYQFVRRVILNVKNKHGKKESK